MEFPRPRQRRAAAKRRKRPLPGTGSAPVPSDRPPQRGAAPHVANTPYGPPLKEARARAEKGRVVALFGPPGVGKSAILACLTEPSELELFIVEPSSTLEEDVEEAQSSGAEVVFLDGAVKSAADVKRLYDQRYVYPGAGAIVQVVADPELIARRASVLHKDYTAYRQALPEIEDAIRVFGLPYFTIHNDDLLQAVLDLADRVQIDR